LVSVLDVPTLIVGSVAALAGQRWSAYLLIANLVAQISFHLIVGMRAYREVMTRLWPKVAPVYDDDWDG